jgi:hypothetical protein
MRILFFVGIASILAYYGWHAAFTMTHPPGILIPDAPLQTPTNLTAWTKGDYRLTPLARFSLDARVLSSSRYHDAGAAIAPLDLALGWGPMSDQAVLDGLDISQVMRFWQWHTRTNTWPAPRAAIEANASNMHIIPKDAPTEAILSRFRTGALVHLEGYLVRVDGPAGFHWSSSLSRSDTGNGACELFWVEYATPLPRLR